MKPASAVLLAALTSVALADEQIGFCYNWNCAATVTVGFSEGELLPIGDLILDADVDGRMDCIDHSTHTTTILGLFERRGWVRFHRVEAARYRRRFLFFEHRAAVIEELPPGLGVVGGEHNAQYSEERFVIDSWFVDPGQRPVVLSLDKWMQGGGAENE